MGALQGIKMARVNISKPFNYSSEKRNYVWRNSFKKAGPDLGTDYSCVDAHSCRVHHMTSLVVTAVFYAVGMDL